jgi:folate-dependent phosphoribosylglycinamide formyltransferase PurN
MGGLRLGVLISGSGTNLQAILDRIDDGTLTAQVAVVVSDKESAFGLERARQIAAQQTEAALASLSCFGDRAEALKAMAQYLLQRNR